MRLLDTRLSYSPFQYQEAYDFFVKQQMSHWLWTEVPLGKDLLDWNLKLQPHEKQIIGNILKGFTIAENIIGDQWSNKIAKWFKHPEIQMMARTFGSVEGIHTAAYANLQETLGLNDFNEFLLEPSAKAKIDRILNVKGRGKEDIAKSLAIFGAMTEGVNLFASFAVLLSFSRRDLLKGVGQIIAWSILDEDLHSQAACWLFRTFVKEYPEVLTPQLKEEIVEGARITIQLEDDFLDKAFELGDLENLKKADVKTFIRYRANSKLKELGLLPNWKNLNQQSLSNMMWFQKAAFGSVNQDFFAEKETKYAKSVADFSTIWDK